MSAKTSNQNIRIQKNVPLPKRTRLPSLPLDKMDVGDSFVLPAENETVKNTVRQRVYRYQRGNPPKMFSIRTESETTVRVFRVDDKPK